jgi:hypothetical protein
MLANAPLAMALVAILAAVATVVCSAELLVRPGVMLDTGLSSWTVSQLAAGWLSGRRFHYIIGWALDARRVRWLLLLRLSCGVVLLFSAIVFPSVMGFAAAVIALVSALLVLRSSYGHDGADQLLVATFFAVALSQLRGAGHAVEIALWFIALLSCLSYLSAGVSKLLSPMWRNGTALPGILATDIYGHPFARLVIQSLPMNGRIACWTVIIFECAFPLVLLGWVPLTISLIIVGLTFHLSTAIFMHLNSFLWAFCATYPAVLFCSFHVSL